MASRNARKNLQMVSEGGRTVTGNRLSRNKGEQYRWPPRARCRYAAGDNWHPRRCRRRINGKYHSMSIAISEEHRALAKTVADFLTDHQSRAAARSLLGAEADALPAFWAALGGLG